MTAAPFISRKTGQFSYFAEQLGDWRWRNREVLDFGGNVGNILRDPNCTIDLKRYWCLEVVEDSIAKGRERFPDAHWHFYDRYCFFFNPHGVPRLPLPDFGRQFDYIVAYSVFPNTDRTDLVDLVGGLRGMLAPGGALAFTFIDPHYRPWNDFDGDNFRWRLKRERKELSSPKAKEILRRAADAEWCILVNGEDLYVESEAIADYPVAVQQTHHTFYTADYIRRLYPEAEVRKPVNGEMQHCCVIRS